MKDIVARREIPREPEIIEPGGRRRRLSVRELRVLAVLGSRPFGLPSIAEVARAADLPPTTTGRILRRMLDNDLVSIDRRPGARGGGKDRNNWVLNSPPPLVAGSPTTADGSHSHPPDRRIPPSHSVPHHFWRHFPNSNPRELALPRDARQVADRLIRSRDPAAFGWALQNLPVGLLARYVQSPGFDAPTRSIIRESLLTRARADHTG